MRADLWATFREDPLRRELLAALLADRLAARDLAAAALRTAEAPSARAAAIGELFAAVLTAEHLERLAAAPVAPLAVELRVACGSLDADAALPLLRLDTAEGLEVFTRIAPICGPEALLAGLLRVPWGGHLPVNSRDLCPALRRALALGLGERLVACLAGSDLLAALLPALAGELRGAALRHLCDQLAGHDDPFRVLALALDLLPHLRPEERAEVHAARPELPASLDAAALRAWIAPQLADAWSRADADPDRERRLDGLERCVASLGPLLTPAEDLRWQEQVVAAALRGDDVLYRLQSGVLDLDLATLTLGERLSPLRTCEALVWIAWGQGEAAARRALDAWIACADPSRAAAELLAMLLSRLDASGRALAAAHLLASPGRTQAHELRALCHLDAPEHRARARELLRDATLVGVELAFTAPHGVAVLARLAAALTGDDRRAVVGLALRRLETTDAPRRAAELTELAPLLDPPLRSDLVQGTLAAPGLAPGLCAGLVATLPEDQVDAALAGPLRRALALPAMWDRWDALRELARALPDAKADAWLCAVFRRRLAAGEAEPDEILALPRRALDLGLRRLRIAREIADPGPYTGWLLGDLARELPADERGPVLDAALAAFDRIALTPTGPGNDAGPFVALADLLDADRCRRALAITERMAAAPWGGDLDVARQALHLRLVACGDRSAEASLLAIAGPSGSAWARGALLALRVRRGEPWSGAAALLAEIPTDVPEARFEALTTAIRELADPRACEECSDDPGASSGARGRRAGGLERIAARTPELAEGLVAAVLELGDDGLRSAALVELFVAGPELLTASRWHALIAAHARGDAGVGLRLALAEAHARREPACVSALVGEVFAAIEAEIEEAIVPLCRLREHLAPQELAHAVARWFAAPPGRRPALLVACSEDELGSALPAALLHLGGPAALRVAAEAIEGLTRALA